MVLRFNVVEKGVASTQELDSIFVQLLQNPGWSEMRTKSSHRLIDQWVFDMDCRTPPPPHLSFLGDFMQRLFDAVQAENPEDPVLPFQCFICLYESGDDSCPNHIHDCRQLTVAFGASRAFFAGEKQEILGHGDAILLDGERHGLPKARVDGPRASINIFYTTRKDMRERPVSVNHNPRNKYYLGPSYLYGDAGEKSGAKASSRGSVANGKHGGKPYRDRRGRWRGVGAPSTNTASGSDMAPPAIDLPLPDFQAKNNDAAEPAVDYVVRGGQLVPASEDRRKWRKSQNENIS